MSKQHETIAYGHPEFGGIVIGGENAGLSYSLDQWDFTSDDVNYKVVIDFFVHGSNATDFAKKMETLEEISRNSGNIAITTGIKTIRTVDVAVVSRTLTITKTAGASFVAADVGMPIDLVGIGSFQITAFVGVSVVTVLVPGTIDVPIASVGTTANVGHRHFAGIDGNTNDIFLSRSEYERSPDGDDDALRRKFRFSVSLGKPASAVRAASFGNRRQATYSVSIGGEQLRTILFKGTYTKGDARDAVANYEEATTGFAAWITTITASFTPAIFQIIGRDSYETDDEKGLLNFTAVRVEQKFPDTALNFNDVGISGAQIRMTRSLDLVHGLPGVSKPYIVQISYSSVIDSTVTSYDEIPLLWRNSIKGHLITQAEAMYGRVMIILNEQGPGVDPVTNTLAASMSVLVSKSGSNIYQYRKTISYSFDERFTDDTIHDTNKNTYASWSPGSQTFATVRVTVTKLGQPDGILGQGETGFFGIGAEPLQISFEERGTNKPDLPSKFEQYPEPGDPKKILGSEVGDGIWQKRRRFGQSEVGDGIWQKRRRFGQISPEFWGEDPDKIGKAIDVSFAVYGQVFLWVSADKSTVDPQRPTSGAGGRVKSKAEREPQKNNPDEGLS